ncbi:MAG: YciC family protein [Actinomycetota bacterium]|nr:YciC family protein [Actinomycetota bacterium]
MAPDLSPKNLGRVLDQAFDIYRANFRTITLSSLAVIFPFALLMGVAQVFYTRGLLAIIPTFLESSTPGELSRLQVWTLLSSGVSPAFWIAQLYIAVAIYSWLPAMMYGERPTVRQLLRLRLMRLVMYGLTAWLVSLLAGLGLLFLLVPGIVVAVFLAFAPIITVAEEASVGRAFSRSFALAGGNAWRIIRFFLLLSVFTFVLETAVDSPAFIRQIVEGLQNPDALFAAVSPGWKFIEGLLTALAISLVYPFSRIAWYCFYLDVRARREGMDMVARARALAEESR